MRLKAAVAFERMVERPVVKEGRGYADDNGVGGFVRMRVVGERVLVLDKGVRMFVNLSVAAGSEEDKESRGRSWHGQPHFRIGR